MFVLVVPGQPVITSLAQISDNQWTVDIPNPSTVNLLTVAITNPLPEGYAAAISYSIAPFQTIEFLGAVANERPSDSFHTAWSFNPNMVSQPYVKLLVSIEMVQNIQELVLNKMSTDVRQEYAKKVALNLFRFMESFNQDTGNSNLLVLPVDVLDKWFLKFEHKFKFDPFFVLKTE